MRNRRAINLFFLLFACSLLLTSPTIAQDIEPFEGAFGKEAFGGGVIQEAFCDILGFMEGGFGAMLAAVAGVMAVCFAAIGNMKYGTVAVITAVSSVTLSSGVSFFFGTINCAQ